MNIFEKLRSYKVASIIGIALIAALTGWAFVRVTTPMAKSICARILQENDEEEERGDRLVEVEAFRVKHGTVTKRIATVGKIRAKNIVTIKAEIGGKIKEVLFKEGSNVQQNDMLIRFDDVDAQAELKEARGLLVKAEREHGRSILLANKQYQSGKGHDEAHANFEAAQAKVEQAESRIRKMNIVAPFSGTMGLAKEILSPGAFIQSGEELVSIVGNELLVEFNIPEKQIHDTGPGQTAEIRVDAFPNEVFYGTVYAVDAQAKIQSHSIGILASINNNDNKLRHGMFANVSLIIGEQGESLVIPETAIEREGEIEFVWVVDRNKASRRRVITGTKENAMVEIIAGLRSGEIVVTVGQIKFSAYGSNVKITNNIDEAPKKPDAKTQLKKAK